MCSVQRQKTTRCVRTCLRALICASLCLDSFSAACFDRVRLVLSFSLSFSFSFTCCSSASCWATLSAAFMCVCVCACLRYRLTSRASSSLGSAMRLRQGAPTLGVSDHHMHTLAGQAPCNLSRRGIGQAQQAGEPCLRLICSERVGEKDKRLRAQEANTAIPSMRAAFNSSSFASISRINLSPSS